MTNKDVIFFTIVVFNLIVAVIFAFFTEINMQLVQFYTLIAPMLILIAAKYTSIRFNSWLETKFEGI